MNFEQSLVLLFVCIFSFAVGEDVKEHDFEIPKMMHNVQNCQEQADAARLKANKESSQKRQAFLEDADLTCKIIFLCEDDYENSDIFSCLPQQALESSISMNSLYFQIAQMQRDYEKQMEDIQEMEYVCTNATTKMLADVKGAGFRELKDCLHSGEWNLVLPVNVEPNTKLKFPAMIENSTASIVAQKSKHFEKSADISRVAAFPSNPEGGNEESSRI